MRQKRWTAGLAADKSTAQFQHVPNVAPFVGAARSGAVMAAVAAAMGLAFGFALFNGNVFDAHVIRQQFVFADNTMLKMFLSAAATSAVVLNSLRIFAPTRSREETVAAEYVNHPRGVAALAIGGVLVGFGMQLSGSCPGTVFVQFGAATPGFLTVLASGVTAAVVFAVLFRRIEESGVLNFGAEAVRSHPQVPGRWSGFVFAAALFAVVAIVDVLSPFERTGTSWHPAVAGVAVGLLQLPATLVLGELIGSSQAYVTFAGSVALAFVPRESLSAYMQKYVRRTMDIYWPLVFAIMAVAGAFIARQIGGARALSSPSIAVMPIESFGGGFLLVFGSRLAAGCTSGHGISGMGSLATGSYIAVAAMFAGAIALGVARALLGV